MGYFKGVGICYSGNCTNPGTVQLADDTEGNPVFYCQSCLDRMARYFVGEAQRIALEIVPTNGKPN